MITNFNFKMLGLILSMTLITFSNPIFSTERSNDDEKEFQQESPSTRESAPFFRQENPSAPPFTNTTGSPTLYDLLLAQAQEGADHLFALHLAYEEAANNPVVNDGNNGGLFSPIRRLFFTFFNLNNAAVVPVNNAVPGQNQVNFMQARMNNPNPPNNININRNNNHRSFLESIRRTARGWTGVFLLYYYFKNFAPNRCG